VVTEKKPLRRLKAADSGPEMGRAELVAVFEDDRRRPIYWFQNSGVVRRLEGVQVFLDPVRRTHCATGPEITGGAGDGS